MRRLVAVACTILAAWAVSASAQDRRFEPIHPRRQVALVVGNSSYKASPLNNPKNDATDVGSRLRQLGFDVDVQLDADRKHMANAVEKFVGKLGPGDVGVFYFSGHGMQVEGENYLIPVDFDGASETDVKYDTFAAGRIQEQMEKSGSQLNILILDACRNNSFHTTHRAAGGGLAMMSAGEGTFLAFATAPGKTASDNGGGRNGLFTAFFLDALREPALSLDDVFNYVRARVAKQSEGKQIPWSQSAVIGKFVFVPGDPVVSGIVPSIPTPRVLDIATIMKQADSLYDAKQYAQAKSWYERAAGSDKKAMLRLGWQYEHGLGVGQDYQLAMSWYQRSAEAGEASAMNDIGTLYESGHGVVKNYQQAMFWYRKAADGGQPLGASNIGYMYDNGEGVTEDSRQAMVWYRKAAAAGDAEGTNNIGWLYETGRGVPKDRNLAIEWYRKAAALGYEKAKANLKRLGVTP